MLIERARAKARLRRGGERERVLLEHVTLVTSDPGETVLAIHAALERAPQVLDCASPLALWEQAAHSLR
jgi:ECF sigma factor